jgi:vinculin
VQSVKESLIALARLSEARHAELINASLRSRLLVANETLRKGSPLLVSALHTYIQNNRNEQALSSRDYAVDQMLNATHEIIVVVSSTDLDESGYTLESSAPLMAAAQPLLLGMRIQLVPSTWPLTTLEYS